VTGSSSIQGIHQTGLHQRMEVGPAAEMYHFTYVYKMKY